MPFNPFESKRLRLSLCRHRQPPSQRDTSFPQNNRPRFEVPMRPSPGSRAQGVEPGETWRLAKDGVGRRIACCAGGWVMISLTSN